LIPGRFVRIHGQHLIIDALIKLSYCKDDRAMRPMYGMGAVKIFGSP